MNNINWFKLLEYRCPKCWTDLIKKKLFYCRACGFMISIGKFYDMTGFKPNRVKMK